MVSTDWASRSLMSAVPVPDPVVEDQRERILLVGDLPSPANPPDGCRFHTRCPWVQPTRCATERPALRALGQHVVADLAEAIGGSRAQVREAIVGHRVACHWAEQIAAGDLTPHAGVVGG